MDQAEAEVVVNKAGEVTQAKPLSKEEALELSKRNVNSMQENQWRILRAVLCYSCKRDGFDSIFIFIIFIYLFLERGRKGERGREISMCGCLLHTPYWGPGLQPRHVP